MKEVIDVTFDFRSDTPPGRDPDTYSPTLSRYHRLLWSRPLPGGEHFHLEATPVPPYYFRHASDLGEFVLSSDAVVPTFSRAREMGAIMASIPVDKTAEFNRLGYTIGGMMVFPANLVQGKMTINGARGFHPRIRDRFDLTVECIRRHYLGQPSPLGQVMERYAGFFDLFGDFASYVDFFLLQDIVDGVSMNVEFFDAFDDFTSSPLPQSLERYLAYSQAALKFLHARNQRIAALVSRTELSG